VLIATTLMHKLHTHYRTKKVPSQSELPKTRVAELIPSLPLKAILLLLLTHNAIRGKNTSKCGPDAISNYGTTASDAGITDQCDDFDDLLTLVFVFPFGESLNASVVADLSSKLLSLSSSSSNAVLFPGGSTAIPTVPISVLVLVTQSTFTEVQLYSQPGIVTDSAACANVTTDVLPRSARDAFTPSELLDEFMAAVVPILPVVLHRAVLTCILEDFQRIKPCVYSCALLT